MREERRPEARAMPEGEHMGRAEAMPGAVSPMVRGGYVPAWYSRLSWGSILAGVLVAIATQLVLSSLGFLVGFGTAAVTAIQDLQDVASAVGIWTAISALISLFVGGLVASRVASVQFTSDGLWHGLTVWALALVGSILLTTLGVSGLLGFATNIAGVLGVTPPGVQVTPGDIQTAADVVATSSGFFLLGALLSLAAALLGGWLGSRRLSRSEAMGEEAAAERRAA